MIWTDTHIRRLHTNNSCVKHSMKLFQEAVDREVHFMQVNGFGLSSLKTVRPIPHQHLSEHRGAHQGEQAEHLCIERSQVPGCTLHSLGAYEPAGRAQRAERLPSPQRDQGAICSALGEHPKILVNVVRALVRSRLSYGLEAMPHLLKTGLARFTPWSSGCRSPCRSAGCTERPGSSHSAATSSSTVVSMFLDVRLSTTPPST